jgi:hypothetical protein
MPPNAVVAQQNDQLWRRILQRPRVTQRFYPQCEICSNKQGGAISSGKTRLAYHLSALRRYHYTGAAAVGITHGGLAATPFACGSGGAPPRAAATAWW